MHGMRALALALFVATLGAAAIDLGGTPPTVAARDAWAPILADAEATCADGSDVHYLERAADPTRVVLYFEGGGACFSHDTCAFDGPDKAYTSKSTVTPAELASRDGIFDFGESRNPLAAHSFVYVPYCTGDLHLGDRATRYGSELTVEHRGYPNAAAALDYLVEAYPDATEVVVAGTSAGSVPTPLFAALVSERLPEARVTAVGDGSGAYPDEPVLNGLIGTLWGTLASQPDWPEVKGLTVREWGIPGLSVHAAAHAPDVTLARIDFAYDAAQASYARLVGIEADELVTLIDDVEAEIERSGADIASYVAPGDAHTVLGSDELYELTVEGVRLIDWLTAVLARERPADVHCVDCR